MVKTKFTINKVLITGIITLSIVSWGFILLNKNEIKQNDFQAKKITVFYSPTCGCCSNYILYLKQKGFKVRAIQQIDLNQVKIKYSIPPNLISCHTSIIEDYVVEGHVPVEAIKKLLTEKPEIAGISLPGMPSGSPGMGGGKHTQFLVHAIGKKGNDLGIFMEF